MARLIDQRSVPPRRPDRKADEDAANPVAESDETWDDPEREIPFIEIGGPDSRAATKPLAEIVNRPAVIPMRREDEVPASAVVIAPATSYFRISFQPLPFPGWPSTPGAPRIHPDLAAFHHPNHAVSQQYRNILQEIEQQLSGEQCRSLLFASLRPGIGTTSVLLNLAITWAKRDKQRIVVVDGNMPRPGVAGRLGIAPTPGLREVLARTAPLMWTVQESALPCLSAIAAGQQPVEPKIDLWPVLLDQLQQRFDWILIDGGEWNNRPEKAALLATAAATYFVLSQADVEGPEVNDIPAGMSRQGGKLRGYILVQR